MLTSNDVYVLQQIHTKPQSLSEIPEISKSSAHACLRKLEKYGLIWRTPGHLWSITPLGHELADIIQRMNQHARNWRD